MRTILTYRLQLLQPQTHKFLRMFNFFPTTLSTPTRLSFSTPPVHFSTFSSKTLTSHTLIPNLIITPQTSKTTTRQNHTKVPNIPKSTNNTNNPITNNTTSMASDEVNDSDILHKFLFFNVYKDGKVTVFAPPMEIVPPVDDPVTGVMIKDVEFIPGLSARVFLPPSTTTTTEKLPVLLYVHGGGFCMQSAFSGEYTGVLTRLVAAGNFIAVSVDYRYFPSTSIAACYNDSWAALRWVTGAGPDGPEPWLARHIDYDRIYVGGDSAGGNISHTLAVRAGSVGLKLAGMILIHPYFGEDDKMWMYMCHDSEGPRDPRMCPATEDLAGIKCGKVLVFVGEKDGLKEAGTGYVEKLKKSGWKGKVELVENKERDHCFHLGDPHDEEAAVIQNKIVSFINDES